MLGKDRIQQCLLLIGLHGDVPRVNRPPLASQNIRKKNRVRKRRNDVPSCLDADSTPCRNTSSPMSCAFGFPPERREAPAGEREKRWGRDREAGCQATRCSTAEHEGKAGFRPQLPGYQLGPWKLLYESIPPRNTLLSFCF